MVRLFPFSPPLSAFASCKIISVLPLHVSIRGSEALHTAELIELRCSPVRTEQLFSNRVWGFFAVWGGGRNKNCNRKITNPPSQQETSQLCPFPTTDVTNLEVSDLRIRVLPSEGTTLPQHRFSPGLSLPGFPPAQITILPSSDSSD